MILETDNNSATAKILSHARRTLDRERAEYGVRDKAAPADAVVP